MKAQEEQLFRQRALAEAGIAYSVGAVLPVILTLVAGVISSLAAGTGYAQTAWYRFLAYLLPQCAFCCAALLFFRRSRVPMREVCRPCKWHCFPLALAMQFGLMFSLSDLNELFVDALGRLGYQSPSSPLPPLDGWNLLPALLIIALLPALFEEVLFRGILAGRMAASGWGRGATVLLSGALFALYHGNPAQTVYQFVCGACFALLTLRAGSILPAAAAHFANNAAILVLTATGYGAEGGWQMSLGWSVAVRAASALSFTVALAALLFGYPRAQERGTAGAKKFFLAAAVGIAVCAVQWVTVLVAGFMGG